ncbi:MULTISPECIES: protein kinase domain-containing protein [unclassified Alteromonas]|uniref:protein kinase domain-containing protein n=1 Tax=unclassified Alteromonas TaxID=2614992 RepID=UPI000E69704E|nr:MULTISPECIES: phosphotransferase [unclassified Alteromonas]AYA64474.1 serine/threonine protein kinase [Alteromonas sp. RKMC-009]MDO6477418.1 serine/threonine protein kinase [Alteromonas sp. 1_MG-2023]
MTQPRGLKHFYIPEDQSVYLLAHKDAVKLRNWVELCNQQLRQLGYTQTGLIGKGAFGFVFAGVSPGGEHRVFKFSRINLPQHVQDRLEEEAFMLAQIKHPLVPALCEFQQIGKQAILVMQRAAGADMEQVSLRKGMLPPRLIVRLAVQMGEVLLALRRHQVNHAPRPVVHGDIKPSNLVWEDDTETARLIDWGSSVFAQLDENGQHTGNNVMDLMSGDMQQTNARLGDVYFIGDEQLNGALSSPRFDEQGLASTLYALASGQSSRYGRKVITPLSLGLPKMLANILDYMLSDDLAKQRQGGDYFFNHLHVLRSMVFTEDKPAEYKAMIPCWCAPQEKDIETVVYSSRKSFLREAALVNDAELKYINDAQFDRYYKNYLQGMGETEKGFISAVSRLGRFPVVGGIAIRWMPDGIYVDSSLNLYDESLKVSFEQSVNNVITLARAIHRKGIFKCCLFNAKDTLHIERQDESEPFIPGSECVIPFELSRAPVVQDNSRTHSYFEDGDDPDELLRLPASIMSVLEELNTIHHTGCVIFEALPAHLKIHSYYTLLDHSQRERFTALLAALVQAVPDIRGIGISGFMKLPYKDTRYFEHCAQLPEKYYPRNPKQANMETINAHG